MRMPSSLLTAAASAAAVLCAMASLGGVVEVAHGFAPPSPTFHPLWRAKTTATSSAAAARGTTAVVETLRWSHRRGTAATTATTTTTTRLLMGWGPDPIWSLGTVTRNFPACPSGSCVSLFVDVDDGSGFVNPGQYVQVRPAGDDEAKPIFLAIASAPTGEAPKPIPPGKKKAASSEADAAAGPETTAVPIPATWEFLIKKTEFNSWITSIVPGSTLSMSQVMGSGFPISENVDGFKYDFPTQNLMLFATGSGIAPIRSAIESDRLGIGRGRTCTLYYGVRTPDDLSYVSKFPEWEGGGVSVVPVISQPDLLLADDAAAAWMGRTGYVQNALEEDGVPIPRNSAALLCGVNGMCDGVKAMLLDSGVFEGRVLKNF